MQSGNEVGIKVQNSTQMNRINEVSITHCGRFARRARNLRKRKQADRIIGTGFPGHLDTKIDTQTTIAIPKNKSNSDINLLINNPIYL